MSGRLVSIDLAVITAVGARWATWPGSRATSTGTDHSLRSVSASGVIALWMLVLLRSRCYDDRVLRLRPGRVPAGHQRQPEARRRRSRSRPTWPTCRCPAASSASPSLTGTVAAAGRSGTSARQIAAPRPVSATAAGPAGCWPSATPRTCSSSSDQLRREWYAGYHVVGACIPDALIAPGAAAARRRAGGRARSATSSTRPRAVSADTVAVTGLDRTRPARRLRRLGWQMEGTGIDLVLAPALTDVAGPRIHMRPIAGLPLIHVESPEFTRWSQGAQGFRRPDAGRAGRRSSCCRRSWRSSRSPSSSTAAVRSSSGRPGSGCGGREFERLQVPLDGRRRRRDAGPSSARRTRPMASCSR